MYVDGISKLYKTGYTADIIDAVVKQWSESWKTCQELANELAGVDTVTTCENIFNFLLSNLHYKEDEEGRQDVKTPARLLYDGVGDCKSYSILAASLLDCLGIPCVLRFVEYDKGRDYQHVYTVAFDEMNEPVVIDAVAALQAGTPFNHELPYSKKKDMNKTKIHMLSGLGNTKGEYASGYGTGGGRLDLYGQIVVNDEVVKLSESIARGARMSTNYLASQINYLEALAAVGVGNVTDTVNEIQLYKVCKQASAAYITEDKLTTAGYVIASYIASGAFNNAFETVEDISSYYNNLQKEILDDINKYNDDSVVKGQFIIDSAVETSQATFLKWWKNNVIANNYIAPLSADAEDMAKAIWATAPYFLYAVVPNSALKTPIAKEKAIAQSSYLKELAIRTGITIETAVNIAKTSIISVTGLDALQVVERFFAEKPKVAAIGAINWDNIFDYVGKASDSFASVWDSISGNNKGGDTNVYPPAPGDAVSPANATNYLLYGGIGLGLLFLLMNKKKGGKR